MNLNQQQPSKPLKPTCKFLRVTVSSGCGCKSLQCAHPECPKSGKRTKIGYGDCTEKNCQWFTPKEENKTCQRFNVLIAHKK